MPSKITLLYIMPAPHAGMPLFTTRYALIPSIILCVTGGIRPYAPRQPIIGRLRSCPVRVREGCDCHSLRLRQFSRPTHIPLTDVPLCAGGHIPSSQTSCHICAHHRLSIKIRPPLHRVVRAGSLRQCTPAGSFINTSQTETSTLRLFLA